MANYILNLLINIFLMIIAIYSVKDLIYKESENSNFLKNVNKNGWFLISIAILTIGFNFYKDYKSELENEYSENQRKIVDSLFQDSQNEILRLQLSAKNSIIEKVESTYVKSIMASNEALAKYNLQISDSLNSVISKLVIDNSNPQFLLQPQEKGKQPISIIDYKGEKGFRLQFTSIGGNCYNILLDIYIVKLANNGTYPILHTERLSHNDRFLAENVVRSYMLDINPEVLTEPELFVVATGKFTKDPQGEIIISYDEAFKYNFRDNLYISGFGGNINALKTLFNIPSKIK